MPADTMLYARTQALVALFTHVAETRMEGVPILNPALRVQAVGFEAVKEAHFQGQNMPVALTEQALDAIKSEVIGAVGILITPWFMNLVRFPLTRANEMGRAGSSRAHVVGNTQFDFIAGYEDSFGGYEACSLFSPMFEFPTPAAALATAQEILATLRRVPEPEPAPVVVASPPRRAFLLGRKA